MGDINKSCRKFCQNSKLVIEYGDCSSQHPLATCLMHISCRAALGTFKSSRVISPFVCSHNTQCALSLSFSIYLPALSMAKMQKAENERVYCNAIHSKFVNKPTAAMCHSKFMQFRVIFFFLPVLHPFCYFWMPKSLNENQESKNSAEHNGGECYTRCLASAIADFWK